MRAAEATAQDIQAVLDSPLDDMVKGRGELLPTQPGVAVWHGDKLIAVGGIVWLWDGVGEAWVILHTNADEVKMGAYRAVRTLFFLLMEEGAYRRVQAMVRTDWERAVKMIEALGFVREGTMKAYFPDGTDAYLYAMVK